MRKIADVADKYQTAALKVTSAARIAIVGLKEEDIDNAWRDLDMPTGAAVGMCVRSIKACPGNTLCRLGQQDTITMGKELDQRYHGLQLPGKMKMGVSGCPNQCAETSVKDLGLIGKAKGWTLVVGGNAASKPRLAETLTENLTNEEALAMCERIVKYFQENAKKGERMGRFMDRTGFDNLKKIALA